MLRNDLRRSTAVAALLAVLMLSLPATSVAGRAPTTAAAASAALGGMDSWFSVSALWDWLAGLVQGRHTAAAPRGVAAAPASAPQPTPPPPVKGADDGWGIDPNG